MRSYLGHLASCHLPTATWAGINDPCNYYTVCSLPSIIVRGPAVSQNKSQLVHVMNEVSLTIQKRYISGILSGDAVVLISGTRFYCSGYRFHCSGYR